MNFERYSDGFAITCKMRCWLAWVTACSCVTSACVCVTARRATSASSSRRQLTTSLKCSQVLIVSFQFSLTWIFFLLHIHKVLFTGSQGDPKWHKILTCSPQSFPYPFSSISRHFSPVPPFRSFSLLHLPLIHATLMPTDVWHPKFGVQAFDERRI